MDRGGFSAAQATQVLKFNGKLFKDAGASGYSLLLEPRADRDAARRGQSQLARGRA